MGLLEICLLVLVVIYHGTCSSDMTDIDEVLVVVICQDNHVSLEKCQNIEDNLQKQAVNLETKFKFLQSSRNFYHDGDWTILPILNKLSESLIYIPPWILFCNEHTVIDSLMLLKVLSLYNSSEEVYLGRALEDSEPTIIHHFSSNLDFKYPLFFSGFAVSRQLFKLLNKTLLNNGFPKDIDFSIDASYELSSYIAALPSNTKLTHSGRFCTQPSTGCATAVSIAHNLDNIVDLKNIYFAVKTCKKFHEDRVPVVLNTWGRKAKNIAFYSDIYDDSIPTVVLNVTNTPNGHCSKTRGIIRDLRSMFRRHESLHWAVITDDDTILSVRRVQELLSSFNASQPIAIGERYGYILHREGGYNYLTGGGGVILSRASILKYVRNTCSCPSPSAPDDMFLFGVCLKRMGISLNHTPLMHQARPSDYSPDYLSIGSPVSFHKHWMIDPILVYQQLFQDFDDNVKASHTEL